MGRCSLFGATIMLTLHQSPFDLFERLEQQMASAERVPNAEVVEADESYTVRLELPGGERDSIEIKATDRTLVVSAERRGALDGESEKPALLSELKIKKKKKKKTPPPKKKKKKKKKS